MARRRQVSPSRTDVFVSHSSRDRAFVERVIGVLHRHGIANWYAPTRILGAQQWQDEIGRALRRCNWFLLVLSKNALNSKWVKRELAYALEDDRYNDHIVSIVKTPGNYFDLSWTLSSIQRVDFRDFSLISTGFS
jgi:TIR domain